MTHESTLDNIGSLHRTKTQPTYPSHKMSYLNLYDSLQKINGYVFLCTGDNLKKGVLH